MAGLELSGCPPSASSRILPKSIQKPPITTYINAGGKSGGKQKVSYHPEASQIHESYKSTLKPMPDVNLVRGKLFHEAECLACTLSPELLCTEPLFEHQYI